MPEKGTESLYSYLYYARRTPGDERPSVWVGDIDGPNVAKVCNHPLMLTARIHAWWRNINRTPSPGEYEHDLWDDWGANAGRAGE